MYLIWIYKSYTYISKEVTNIKSKKGWKYVKTSGLSLKFYSSKGIS